MCKKREREKNQNLIINTLREIISTQHEFREGKKEEMLTNALKTVHISRMKSFHRQNGAMNKYTLNAENVTE